MRKPNPPRSERPVRRGKAGHPRYFLRAIAQSRSSYFAAAFLVFFLSTAFLFWYLEHDHPAQRGNLETPLDVVYWWLVTCATVGYGDIAPKTQAGRMLVGIMVIIGISMMTTLVARIGSFFVERRLELTKGLGNMDPLSDHIVLCGWHDDLDGILRAMLHRDPSLDPGQIVLLTQVNPEWVNALRSRPEFKSLNFVAGDVTDQTDLKRAGVDRARSVMILVDPKASGADSTALLGVMSVRQLNRKAHLCAEVHEERFVQYMLRAGCNEVIHPGSFRRSLAAQSMLSPGVGNVFYDLLNFDQGVFLATEEVSERFVGRPFAELQQTYAGQQDVLLIGLLENVGNPYEMKQQAIRHAQKAPDISRLVAQLREAKEKMPNAPVLCPGPDRLMQPRTCAVVIRRRSTEEKP
jgi:voltage-gated potassium channel